MRYEGAVYTCDRCGAIGLAEIKGEPGKACEYPPDGWLTGAKPWRGGFVDLCAACAGELDEMVREWMRGRGDM